MKDKINYFWKNNKERKKERKQKIEQKKIVPDNYCKLCMYKVILLIAFLLCRNYGGPQLSRQNQKPHRKTKNLTAKTKTSRQKQKPHGKPKNLTAKTKYVTTKPKPSRQNQRPNGKTKYFTAKTKYLTAKANTMAKPKLFCSCSEVLGFDVRYFVFAVRFLVLL